MKPKTSTHPGEGMTVPAGTPALVHWVPTAVTSTQTIRAGSTVLHHIFILICGFPEGSTFQRANPTTYSHVTPPVTCSPAGSTTELIHDTSIPWHWEWPQRAQVPFFPDSCQVYGSHSCYCSHGNLQVNMEIDPRQPFSQAQVFLKKVNLQAVYLTIPVRNHSGIAPRPICICDCSRLPGSSTWQLCCICQGCNTQPWQVGLLLHYQCADTGVAQDVYWLHMHCSCLLNQWAQVCLAINQISQVHTQCG